MGRFGGGEGGTLTTCAAHTPHYRPEYGGNDNALWLQLRQPREITLQEPGNWHMIIG